MQIPSLISIAATTLSTEVQRHIQENCNVLLSHFESAFEGDQNELINLSRKRSAWCYRKDRWHYAGKFTDTRKSIQ